MVRATVDCDRDWRRLSSGLSSPPSKPCNEFMRKFVAQDILAEANDRPIGFGQPITSEINRLTRQRGMAISSVFRCVWCDEDIIQCRTAFRRLTTSDDLSSATTRHAVFSGIVYRVNVLARGRESASLYMQSTASTRS